MPAPLDGADSPGPARIRPARPEDVPALVALLAQLFAIERDFSADADRQGRGLALLLRTDGAIVLVAEISGRVVGMVSVQTLISTAEGGPVGNLEDLVVDGGCRGMGIGSRLLRAAEEWAEGRGLGRLQLLADRGNAPAIGFYAGAGWAATELVAMRRRCGD